VAKLRKSIETAQKKCNFLKKLHEKNADLTRRRLLGSTKAQAHEGFQTRKDSLLTNSLLTPNSSLL